MSNVVVLIIVHKSKPTPTELASLKQCSTILNSYPIVLIAPSGLDMSSYTRISSQFKIQFIKKKWLSTYRMFNRLKVSPLLYKIFSDYNFILFYELDCWIFRDDLEFWCNKNFDYIGAPWFDGFDKANGKSQFIGVGNGGFSLRRIDSHLRVLNTLKYIRTPKEVFRKVMPIKTLRSAVKLFYMLTIGNNTHYWFNDFKRNEDKFWGLEVPHLFDWFKVAPFEEAMRFSMEVNAPHLYELNKNNLPFGCHKWEKIHPEFWKQFIPY